MNTKDFFKKHVRGIKRVTVFQNHKYFIVPTFQYDAVNPEHCIIVRGIKKKKYRSGSANPQKIAMLFKTYYGYYWIALYMVLGWLIFCKL